MSVFVALALPVVVGLGVWQLERAAGKRGAEQTFIERMSARPVAPPARLDDVDFLRVRLVGEFEAGRYFLVDNQVAGGRSGYWVIASFRSSGERRWLVNRGWIAAPVDRHTLPEVPHPAGRLEIVAAVWPDTGLVPLLAEDSWQEPWPIRVQRLNVARMARLLDNAAPREIRLEAGQPGVLGAISVKTGFDSQRHEGYALQWFALAAVLLLGYVIFGFKNSAPETRL